MKKEGGKDLQSYINLDNHNCKFELKYALSMYVYEIVEWSEPHIAFPVKAIKGFALEYANSTRGQQEKREKGIKENSPPWISSLITVVIKERGGNCNKARDRMNRKGPSPSPFSLPLVPWPYLSVSLSPLQLWTEQSYSNGDRFLPLVFLLPFFSTFFFHHSKIFLNRSTNNTYVRDLAVS